MIFVIMIVAIIAASIYAVHVFNTAQHESNERMTLQIQDRQMHRENAALRNLLRSNEIPIPDEKPTDEMVKAKAADVDK